MNSARNRLEVRNRSINLQMNKLFWFGFAIYTLGFAFSRTEYAIFIICDLARVVGIAFFLLSFLSLVKFNFSNNYLKLFFTALLFWTFITIFRGIDLDYESIKDRLFIPYGGVFIYLAPLILLVPRNKAFYETTFRVIMYFGIFYIIFLALSLNTLFGSDYTSARNALEIFFKTFGFSCGFLLLVYNYIDKKIKYFALAIMVITLICTILLARRGTTFLIAFMLIFYGFIYISSNKYRFRQIVPPIFFSVFFLFFAVIFFSPANLGLFDKFKDRFDEDTRSGVEEYFYQDMQSTDWIIGRGMSGQVAAPIGLDSEDDMTGMRDGIETGYLEVILKGGLIKLFLLLAIAIPAVYNGIFRSKNSLSKAAGYWIFIWLISLYPSTAVTFTLNYLLVWIAIGICFSSEVRNIPEAKLREQFIQ